MPDLIDLFRGAAAAPQGYRESGVSGIAQALSDPAPFEQQGRDAKYREAYAPIVQGIEQSLSAGDADSAVTQVMSLRQQMTANNARPEDIKRFAGGYFQQALQSGFNTKPLDQTEGQNFALKGSAMADPARASDVAVQGAQLGGLRQAPAVAQANIEQSQAATAASRANTEQIIPAQAESYRQAAKTSEARAGAYNRGEMGGRKVTDMFGRNAGVIQRYDSQIIRALKPGKDGKAVNPEAVQGFVDQRNFAAREFGMPEAEITPIYDMSPQTEVPPIGYQGSAQPQLEAPVQTYALRPKQEAAKQQAPQNGGGLSFGPVPAPPPVQSRPLPQVDAMQGVQGGQQRPPFQAAVQNPLGALPAQLQQAIQDPSTPIPTTNIVGTYMQQGYSEQEANALTDALLQQLKAQPSSSPPPLSAGQAPTRDPFQPSAGM